MGLTDFGMNNHVKISVLTSLYRCEQFLESYFKYLSEINGTDKIEVLLLHNDPQENETEIIIRRLPKAPFVRHIIIPEREGLYSTWNRGIRLAQGEYITVWNVDDVRFPNSILQQTEAMDKNPEAAIAYGDIWVSSNYGECNGFCTNSPENNCNKDFFKQYHISCFQMWRKSIHETIGYYDEQFKCVADFDFQIRAALHYLFVKTDEPLGIYLEDQPHKLSANGLSDMERNIVYLRYGVYQHLNLALLRQAKRRYRQNKMLFFNKWCDFTEQAPFGKLYKATGFICACFRSFYWLCRQTAKKIVYYDK
ncbi:MAG: glycosyltransferase [Dysgonamonadaceae bacterium]|jgi:glycosyltransferase involved in cell wall biosynthesis|nr:glycosyltransferase [Dysgonamonadaceae bacterium]